MQPTQDSSLFLFERAQLRTRRIQECIVNGNIIMMQCHPNLYFTVKKILCNFSLHCTTGFACLCLNCLFSSPLTLLYFACIKNNPNLFRAKATLPNFTTHFSVRSFLFSCACDLHQKDANYMDLTHCVTHR